MSRYLIPRLRDVLFLAILMAALALAPRVMNTDGDLGRHLTMGRTILETHQIPNHDLFSHTRLGDARPAYEWLTQVVFAGAEKYAGLDGPLFVTAICIAMAFSIVLADAARRSQLPLTALVITALAAAASSLHWLARPHVVTFLLLALWLERLERLRLGESDSRVALSRLDVDLVECTWGICFWYPCLGRVCGRLVFGDSRKIHRWNDWKEVDPDRGAFPVDDLFHPGYMGKLAGGLEQSQPVHFESYR